MLCYSPILSFKFIASFSLIVTTYIYKYILHLWTNVTCMYVFSELPIWHWINNCLLFSGFKSLFRKLGDIAAWGLFLRLVVHSIFLHCLESGPCCLRLLHEVFVLPYDFSIFLSFLNRVIEIFNEGYIDSRGCFM